MGWSNRIAGQLLLLLFLAALCGSTCRIAFPSADAPIQTHGTITLYRHPMEVRLSKPANMPSAPILIIYATGDGGWRGMDEKLFGWIASSGWPIAGFSSKNYLKNLSYFSETDTTTPRQLVKDYRRIIAFARSSLNLPEEAPVLFVGNSRGAGLSVVAGGQGELKQHLAGVIAVALTREEEHVVRSRARRGRAPAGQPNRELMEIKTYEYLARLSSFPVCVLQSTNDGYLPAASARRLFGPDGEFRRLRSIEAHNHRFSGGSESLHDELLSALHWVADVVARPLPGSR